MSPQESDSYSSVSTPPPLSEFSGSTPDYANLSEDSDAVVDNLPIEATVVVTSVDEEGVLLIAFVRLMEIRNFFFILNNYIYTDFYNV